MTNAKSTQSLQTVQIEKTEIDFAEDIARQVGVRLTPIRRHVYTCLLQAKHPLGAYDILDMLNGVGSQKPPTVYRALNWLMKMGLVKKVASVSKYVALHSQKNTQTVAFLLCQTCGQTESFDPGQITQSLNIIAEKSGFSSSETVIEIIGQCNKHRIR